MNHCGHQSGPNQCLECGGCLVCGCECDEEFTPVPDEDEEDDE